MRKRKFISYKNDRRLAVRKLYPYWFVKFVYDGKDNDGRDVYRINYTVPHSKMMMNASMLTVDESANMRDYRAINEKAQIVS